MKAHLLLAVLLACVLACGDERSSQDSFEQSSQTERMEEPAAKDSAQNAPVQSAEECLSRYKIRLAFAVPATGGSRFKGSGVLEQRVLEDTLIVLAELLDVELNSAETDSVGFELKGLARAYEDNRFTLLYEVELRVLEYLKGEGPDTMKAVVESQVVFNSQSAGDCAKTVFMTDFSGLFDSQDGIAFLEPTIDPDVYHMGLAYENFKGEYYHHSTWWPGK